MSSRKTNRQARHTEKAKEITRTIMDNYDTNHDNMIDREEFRNMLSDINKADVLKMLRDLEVGNEDLLYVAIENWLKLADKKLGNKNVHIADTEMERFIGKHVMPRMRKFLGREPSTYEIQGVMKDMRQTDPRIAARADLRELLGREPTQQEVSDWMEEFPNGQIQAPPVMNDPLRNMQALNPTYTDNSSWLSYNMFFVMLMAAAALFFYKFRKNKNEDEDDFVKPAQPGNYMGLGYIGNPFDRNKRDGDNNDDFDRQV